MHNSRANRNHGNRGFTLLELLIVVTVIATLITLSVVVMIGIADDAQETATVTTLQKLNRLVDQRLEAFDRGFPAVSDTWEENFREYVAIELEDREGVPRARGLRLLTAFTSELPVWEILARKAAYRFEFPQRFFDIDLVTDVDRASLTGDQRWPGLIRSRYLNEVAVLRHTQRVGSAPNATELAAELQLMWQNHEANPETESAELLYFMLFHSGSYGASSIGEDDFDVAEIADTDDDGMPEFVDSWGNPLRFYRWPTRLIDPFLPLTAFRPGNLPDRTDQDEVTDLQMIVGVDGTWETVAPTNGRTVTVGEREVADYLIKGLPRRLEFDPAYLTAIAASFTDRPAPTRDVNVIVPPDPLLRDPDDPAGLLYALLEDGLPIAGTTIDMSWEFNEDKYHTPDTFHAPLIVSAGLDGELGLYEPNDTGNLGHLAMYDIALTVEELVDTLGDNLSNRNRRAGGQR